MAAELGGVGVCRLRLVFYSIRPGVMTEKKAHDTLTAVRVLLAQTT